MKFFLSFWNITLVRHERDMLEIKNKLTESPPGADGSQLDDKDVVRETVEDPAGIRVEDGAGMSMRGSSFSMSACLRFAGRPVTASLIAAQLLPWLGRLSVVRPVFLLLLAGCSGFVLRGRMSAT